MSKKDYSEWVDDIHRKAEQLSIVFLQLGYSNEPARRALLASRVRVQSVSEYFDHGDPTPRGILVIDQVESLATVAARANMGKLREQVFHDVSEGTRVILLSRAPRIAFPIVVGSSLLDDASFAHAPSVQSANIAEWPTCSEDDLTPNDVLRCALNELGTELCSSLDRAVYENSLTGDDALNLLTARELEALDGAGLTAPVESQRVWNFPKHLSPLKSALSEVLADALEPQVQLADVSSGLWKIERIIRREIRRRAIEAWAENWRVQCLNGDLPEKVLDRASESAYLGARSLKHLRDPLEWLSLGELLQLKDRKEIGSLGLSASHWRQFGVQIMPIRNRLAHMRSLRPEDSADVIKWRRLFEAKF